MMHKFERMIRGLVSRAIVNAQGAANLFQVLWLDDRVSADVEYLEPQGVHFRPPVNADGVLLAPSGNKSASVLLNAQGIVPEDALQPGEGGLHYLGTYRVFTNAAGEVLLGEGPSLSAAVAEYCDARFTAIETVLNGHLHSGVTTGPGNSGPLVTPLTPGTSVASTKVKITP